MIRDFPVRDSPALREHADAWQAGRSRSRPGRRPPSCSCATAPPASRSSCCAAWPRWRSRRAMWSSPAAGSTRATPTRACPGPGRRRAEWAGAARDRRGHGPRAGRAPRCARSSRSAACCSPGPPPTSVVADISGAALGGGAASRCSTGRSSLAEVLIAPGLVLRSDLLGLGRTGSPPCSSRAATTPGSSSPRCPRASVPTTSPPRPTTPTGSAPRERPRGLTSGVRR